MQVNLPEHTQPQIYQGSQIQYLKNKHNFKIDSVIKIILINYWLINPLPWAKYFWLKKIDSDFRYAK